MSDKVSRRNFLKSAPTAAAGQVAAAVVGVPAGLPKKVWTVIGLNWNYNDEYAYEDGNFTTGKLFFSLEEAQAACQKMCDAWFAWHTPEEFEPDWSNYDEVDPATCTWPELVEVGFPNPYHVEELNADEQPSGTC